MGKKGQKKTARGGGMWGKDWVPALLLAVDPGCRCVSWLRRELSEVQEGQTLDMRRAICDMGSMKYESAGTIYRSLRSAK